MNHTPRVAAAHDMSGLGRCSLTVILPVLSVMGVQCCPLQTAYLSADTAFPASSEAAFLDMSGEMAKTLRHWKELQVEFDAIYSGFLGSKAQIEILYKFISAFRRKDNLVLVDPVLGDHGKLYRTFDNEMCRRMGSLASAADLITPNLTEAALLLGEPYENAPVNGNGIEDWLSRLSQKGRRSVIITGVRLNPGQVGAACFDRETGKCDFSMAEEVPGEFSGTGDLFAAVSLGALMRGKCLGDAMDLAVRFVSRCTRETFDEKTPLLCGVEFERMLQFLL